MLFATFGIHPGKFQNGKFDSIAVNGKDLELTIDNKLQKYVEQLMQNKKGSIFAIEPSTGEILALVSSPYYDPNLLIGRSRSQNFNNIQRSDKPLFDRSCGISDQPLNYSALGYKKRLSILEHVFLVTWDGVLVQN